MTVQLLVTLRSLRVQRAGNDVKERSEDEVGASETWTFLLTGGIQGVCFVMTPK